MRILGTPVLKLSSKCEHEAKVKGTDEAPFTNDSNSTADVITAKANDQKRRN
jgi:hypothetical protein